jgi:hypothetical protein
MRNLIVSGLMLLGSAVWAESQQRQQPPSQAATGQAPSQAPTTPAPSQAASAPASAQTKAPTTKALRGHGEMEHCPAAVHGAKLVVTETKDGVILTITGKDDAEIRKRAKHLVDASQVHATNEKHNGQGAGGGFGPCPVVIKDTTVAAEDVPGGSKITVKPNSASDLGWLKKETKSRQVAMVNGAKGKKS